MIGDLKIYEPGQELLAATYGRGTWETPLYSGSTGTNCTITVSAAATGNESCNESKREVHRQHHQVELRLTLTHGQEAEALTQLQQDFQQVLILLQLPIIQVVQLWQVPSSHSRLL